MSYAGPQLTRDIFEEYEKLAGEEKTIELKEAYTTKDGGSNYALFRLATRVRDKNIRGFMKYMSKKYKIKEQAIYGYEAVDGVAEKSAEGEATINIALSMILRHKYEENPNFLEPFIKDARSKQENVFQVMQRKYRVVKDFIASLGNEGPAYGKRNASDTADGFDAITKKAKPTMAAVVDDGGIEAGDVRAAVGNGEAPAQPTAAPMAGDVPAAANDGQPMASAAPDWQRLYEQGLKDAEAKDMLLGEKDVLLGEKDMLLREKDMLLREKDVLLREKDVLLREKDVRLNEKDEEIDLVVTQNAELFQGLRASQNDIELKRRSISLYCKKIEEMEGATETRTQGLVRAGTDQSAILLRLLLATETRTQQLVRAGAAQSAMLLRQLLARPPPAP